MKTYLLLLFCTILQFLHAGWLFLHGLGTMPPDTAFVQVASVSDAQAVLDSVIPGSVSANELAALAEDYGVGFMIGEFGIFTTLMPYNRYADETLSAYYRDMVGAMTEKDYGWCGGVWDGTYGVVSYYPAVKTAAYEQVGDHDFYIDRAMFDLFQDLNGVK